MKKIIWLVIPCYNEQEVLPETSRQLEEIMRGLIKKDKISDKSKIAFVNDGSKDNTWNRMACPGGCVAGAGTMQPIKKSQASVNLYASKAKHKTSNETEHVKELDKLVD